jgi:AmmeMemoRadiSam system protein A
MRPPEPLDGHRLARLAREAIAETLGGPPVSLAAEAPDPPGASFVTLTLDGALRGCMGSVFPEASLREGVMDHARAAAFRDTRFDPLAPADLPRISVEVSVLSALRPLAVTGEADLRARLHPGEDGLLLEMDGRQATFLPQVWSELPEPAAFLGALQRKAGWPRGGGSPRIRAWTYTVEAWRDEPRPVPLLPAVLLGAEGGAYLHPARHWHRRADGRLRCEVCPHGCSLGEGQTGRCRVRQRARDRMVLAAYGAIAGFAVDPVEKKPIYHFLPGAPLLSFGAVGCSLSCGFCQNWSLSQARDLAQLRSRATPGEVARTARRLGCAGVAFTYNEPTILLEWVADVADACHAEGSPRWPSPPASWSPGRGGSSSRE